MKSQLKPCPFCGGTETISEPDSRNWTGMRWDILSWKVTHWCSVPGLGDFLIIRGKTQEIAEGRWNTRQ